MREGEKQALSSASGGARDDERPGGRGLPGSGYRSAGAPEAGGAERASSSNHGGPPPAAGTPLTTTGLSRGDMVAEYQVTGLLGKGGMGTVYAGVQPVIGKAVAIKVLLPEFASNSEVVTRFVQEARAVNQARSRYIVDIFSFGSLTDGRHYFVMEHLDGKALREVISERGPLSLEYAFGILQSVAKGLAAAHEKGIVHRDLKPENIMVLEERDGTVTAKLLDFGIAKLLHQPGEASLATKTGMAMGTPYYMSPEQCRGVNVDRRTDIYALGVIMYEMFTGRLPFEAQSYIDLVNKHLFSPPVPPSQLVPSLAPQLEAFILRCIAKSPDGRPHDSEAFLYELREIVGSSQELSDPSVFRGLPGSGPVAAPPPSGPAAAVRSSPAASAHRSGVAPTIADGESQVRTGPAAPAAAGGQDLTLPVLTTGPPAPPSGAAVAGSAAQPGAAAQPSAAATAAQVAAGGDGGEQTRSRGLVWLVVAVVLLGAGGAAGGFFYWQHIHAVEPARDDVDDGLAGAGGDTRGPKRAGSGVASAASSGGATPPSDPKPSRSAGVQKAERTTLEIGTKPEGAAVVIDGQRQAGKTPLTAKLKPGKHVLEVRVAGHDVVRQDLKLEAGEKRTLTLALVKSSSSAARSGGLRVVTGLRRATYYVDGAVAGHGRKLAMEGMEPGKHQLRVVAPGRRPAAQKVLVQAGRALRLTLRLERRRRRGAGKRSSKPRGTKTKTGGGRIEDPDDTIDPFKRRRRHR